MKRKIDSTSRGRKALQYRGTKCLNCGHPLDRSDIYCPHCSQLNSDKQLSVKDFFSEFIRSIIVYDSRLRNTLKALLFRPGVITRNYIEGQRLRYANPFRFFLSVSIIYFLLKSFGGFIKTAENFEPENSLFAAGNETPIDSLLVDPQNGIFNQQFLGDTLKAKTLGIPAYYSEETLDSLSFFEEYRQRASLYHSYFNHSKIENPAKALDSLGHTNSISHRWLYSRAISFYKITHHTDEFVKYISSKLPFFLFFFTPFYALFFWLSYSREKYTYMEHIIFVFHIFSFIFLSMLIFWLPQFLLDTSLFQNLLFFILGPLYFYLALRKFYGQGKRRTLFKFVFLSIVFGLSFIFAMSLFVAFSAAVY